MKQKKLIIFMPSVERGGVEKNLFIVLNYLQKKFKNIAIISSDKDEIRKKNKKIKIIKNFNFLNIFKNRSTKYISCLFSLIWQVILNKNVVVLSFQANLYAILICKIFGIKIVIRSNSSSFIWASSSFKILIFKSIMRLSDGIIVNSSDLKNEFLKKFKVHSSLIFNPLNTREIKKLSQQKKRSFFDDNKKVLKIISVGRLIYQKDHLTFLKALNILNSRIRFKALIVGSGSEKNKLENYINQNNLEGKVQIFDYLKNPFPLIKKADIFVLTSVYEGLPNVLLEALVLKKVIFSTNCQTGPKEILENGKIGTLFKVGDYKSLSLNLIKFIRNKKKYEKKISYYNNSLKKYDYNKNLKKYFLLINQFI